MSVQNLPAAKAHVCRYSSSRNQRCASGLRYITFHNTSRITPRELVTIKVNLQPKVVITKGTTAAVKIIPILAPLLKMPTSLLRSRAGNYSATVFTAEG
jgi:hypothetical protein